MRFGIYIQHIIDEGNTYFVMIGIDMDVNRESYDISAMQFVFNIPTDERFIATDLSVLDELRTYVNSEDELNEIKDGVTKFIKLQRLRYITGEMDRT